jgi:protein subunit release factor A
VPETEARGRVHTSTVTCAVLDVETTTDTDSIYSKRNPDDFAYRWYSGTGKGGQKRNKSQSCLELTHIPSGLSQQSHGRSREVNSTQAMTALIADLDSMAKNAKASIVAEDRKGQIGSGMRGDKRRTYRFQDGTITDHVTGRTITTKAFSKGNLDLLW